MVENPEKKQVVTPWDVEGSEDGIDYQKIITDFGCSPMSEELIERFEKLTGHKAHHLMRRGVFYSHREFDKILDCVEQKKPFYLYTGRGPSNKSLHLGHTIPFIFNAYLQKVFDCPLVIQITDDEKFLFKKELKLDETIDMGKQNIKDIIAFGFNPEKTFIFSNVEYISHIFQNTLKIQKMITFNQVKGLFGLGNSDNIGKIGYPAIQGAPCFPDTFQHIFGKTKEARCLIPCAIDQDPYFKMVRDISQKLGYKKTSTIYSKFLPALAGLFTKMSAGTNDKAIMLDDTPKQIGKKINKFAFSGGGATLEEHREKGGNIAIDIPYIYLTYFLEDDEKLKTIAEEYSSGKMLTGEIKKELIDCLGVFVADYQEKRAAVTDEDVKLFTSVRKMDPSVGLYSRE